MKLEKLNKMLEQDIEAIKNTKIITTDTFQFTIGSDMKTLYVDNITEIDQPVDEILNIIREYVGDFVTGIKNQMIDDEDILVLEFDEEFNESEVISAIQQIELLNSDETFEFQSVEKPEVLF